MAATQRLLVGVPLPYLVPDASALPENSLRFFEVDGTWTDDFLRGTLEAGAAGLQDYRYPEEALYGPRGIFEQVEDQLWQRSGLTSRRPPNQRITLSGLLLRSSVVRKWPGLEVRGFSLPNPSEEQRLSHRLKVLRRAYLSRSILLVLFGGEGPPARVEIAEPDQGLRFGIEVSSEQAALEDTHLDLWNPDGTSLGSSISVPIKAGSRLIDARALAQAASAHMPEEAAQPMRSSLLSLQLQQRPYVQVIK